MMHQRLPPMPDPPELLNIRLDSLGDIRREMAAVYRETRSKRMHPSVASRLIYMLTTLTATLLAERKALCEPAANQFSVIENSSAAQSNLC